MRIAATKEQKYQCDDNMQDKDLPCISLVNSTSACSATNFASVVQRKKAQMWSLLGGGLLCALFSLNAAADTGVCGYGKTYTLPIPMPALIVPAVGGISGPSIANVRVPISFTCNNFPIVRMQSTNPNAFVAMWTPGTETLPTAYGRSPNGPSLWYKLRFENVTIDCTNGSNVWNQSFPTAKANIMHSGIDYTTGNYIYIGTTAYILPPGLNIPISPGAPCKGQQRLSADAVFDFFATSDFTTPGPLSGLVARVSATIAPDLMINPELRQNMTIDLVFGGGIVTSKSCQLSTSGSVQMGKVPAKDIESGVAPLSLSPATINITNCPANAEISLKAEDASGGSPNPNTQILNLSNATSSTAAKGVGISLYYDGSSQVNSATPISLGAATTVIASTVDGAQQPIQLKARYVRDGTGAPVTPGQANAQATITLGYQ